jgi:hypothetical protein
MRVSYEYQTSVNEVYFRSSLGALQAHVAPLRAEPQASVQCHPCGALCIDVYKTAK